MDGQEYEFSFHFIFKHTYTHDLTFVITSWKSINFGGYTLSHCDMYGKSDNTVVQKSLLETVLIIEFNSTVGNGFNNRVQQHYIIILNTRILTSN